MAQGFNPQELKNSALTANSVVVMIGNEPIAFAQTVDADFNFGTEQLYGIGNSLPQDIVQLRVGPTISLTSFALTTYGQQLTANGVNLPYILSNNKFNIGLLDQTNKPFMMFVSCVASGFRRSIQANQIVSDNTMFMAQDVWDNAGNSILQNPNNALSITTVAQVAGAT